LLLAESWNSPYADLGFNPDDANPPFSPQASSCSTSLTHIFILALVLVPPAEFQGDAYAVQEPEPGYGLYEGCRVYYLRQAA
jgi:hypothetical protein